MSFEAFKFPKVLVEALLEKGISSPFPIQSKVLPRIAGGQELICIGPEGCGKSLCLVLGVLVRLKFAQDVAPRALVLTSNKEQAVALVELFQSLGEKLQVRTIGLYPGAGMEGQKEALADGVDVVVGTPERVLSIYLKSALNMNKLQQFILDDAEMIVKQGLQGQIHQLALSLPKCQRLVFSQVLHEKLEKLSSAFQSHPQVVESDSLSDKVTPTIPLFLYKVPNYKTKQNLLHLLVQDADTCRKMIVFTNTKLTSKNLYKSLQKRFPGEIALLKPANNTEGFLTVQDFKRSKTSRVLFVANETEQFADYHLLGHIVHFDLPENTPLIISRMDDQLSNADSLIFATDIELIIVKKIEHLVGKKMEVLSLPTDLVIEGDRKKKKEVEEQNGSDIMNSKLGAFHEKKISNAKGYNWGWKEKNKLFGKKYKKSNKK